MLQDDILSKLHQTIKGVTDDIEHFKYNTAISKIMQLVNEFTKYKVLSTEYLKPLALLLAPFAPHMMEEVWVSKLSMPFSIHKAQWPLYEAKYITSSEALIVVQINGKMRGQISVVSDQSSDQKVIEQMAKEDSNVSKWIKDSEIKKVIFIPGKVINFVV